MRFNKYNNPSKRRKRKPLPRKGEYAPDPFVIEQRKRLGLIQPKEGYTIPQYTPEELFKERNI